jgi:hypothetical protein
MSKTHIVYYFFMSAAFTCSCFLLRKEKGFTPLSLLLFLSIITEIVVDILRVRHIERFIVYHIYIPVEYSLMALFFARQNIVPVAKRAILFSVPAFVIVSCILSAAIIQPPNFPSVQFNLEGVFLILTSVYILFTIEVDSLQPFYTFPIFWICSGIILFHAGLFLFNGAYNYLLIQETEEAKYLHTLINTNLQYLLYLFWIIGFLCPLRKKNFITH